MAQSLIIAQIKRLNAGNIKKTEKQQLYREERITTLLLCETWDYAVFLLESEQRT